MRRYTTAGVDDALTGLAATLDDLTGRITDQDTALTGVRDDLAVLHADVAAHTRTLTTLSHALHTPTDIADRTAAAASADGSGDGTRDGGAGADPAGPAGEEPEEDPVAVAWLTVEDPAVAVGWLNDLAVWVPRVWQPYLATPTPGCWPWHPAVVAELLVVRHLFADAVAAAPDPAPLAGWHDRWRPGAHTRISRLTMACERAEGRHKIRGTDYRYDPACLDELAEWWATTHGTDRTRPVPGLAPIGRTR